MAETYSCKDCTPGNAIEGRVVRVERVRKRYGTEGPLAGRVIAVDRLKGWDIYCVAHYEAREARGEV